MFEQYHLTFILVYTCEKHREPICCKFSCRFRYVYFFVKKISQIVRLRDTNYAEWNVCKNSNISGYCRHKQTCQRLCLPCGLSLCIKDNCVIKLWICYLLIFVDAYSFYMLNAVLEVNVSIMYSVLHVCMRHT